MIICYNSFMFVELIPILLRWQPRKLLVASSSQLEEVCLVFQLDIWKKKKHENLSPCISLLLILKIGYQRNLKLYHGMQRQISPQILKKFQGCKLRASRGRTAQAWCELSLKRVTLKTGLGSLWFALNARNSTHTTALQRLLKSQHL